VCVFGCVGVYDDIADGVFAAFCVGGCVCVCVRERESVCVHAFQDVSVSTTILDCIHRQKTS